jgi:hypothetical protein
MPEAITEKPNNRTFSPLRWFTIVMVVAIIERLLVVLLYQPVSYSDTPSYRRLAETVLHGFANYDGTRMPGYPVFLAIIGGNRQVWLVQLLLGLITTLLFFYIGWKITDKAWFGGVLALIHTLNLGQLFFESNLLTESLTTFLLVFTMAGVLIWLLNSKARTIWLAFLLGLSSTLTLLVRPLFIYLPFLILIFLWLASRLLPDSKVLDSEGDANNKKQLGLKHRRAWLINLALLFPVVILLGGWIGFIHQQFGEWSLTTMTGYHLVQHTGNFFEYVPDEYASVRDTYIKYRDEHIAQYGTQTNTIWEAIPEMSRVSGYSFYALSRVLTRISIQLILKHPFLYARNVASGWWLFWRTSFYWSAEALKLPWLAGGINVAILLQRGFLFLINLSFIFASLFFMFSEAWTWFRHQPASLQIRYSKPAQQIFFWFLLVNIWITSFLQTLLDHGDNPRFLVPVQTLVVLWVAAFILQLIREKMPHLTHKQHA